MLKYQMKRTLGRQSQRALTLIEVMIVVAIMGLLATLLVVNVVGAFDDAKVDAADIKLASIQSAIQRHQIKNGYPNDLKDLLNPKRGSKAIKNEKDLLDPWGNEIIYKKGKGNQYTLISKGPDGTMGTDDDQKLEND